MLRCEPIEGYFIITKEKLIFEVKGVVQPEERLITYLRYVPCSKGNRCSEGLIQYRKIYDLSERSNYLQQKYPEYLWFDESYDRVFQSVPKNKVTSILNPVLYYQKLREQKQRLSDLSRVSVNLTSILVNQSQIAFHDIGITGSQLVRLSLDESDIDLVVYGELAARKVYSKMSRLFSCEKKFKLYFGKKLDYHVDFRWGKGNKYWKTLREIESKKILQGFYGKYEFYIRMVKLPHEMNYSYGQLKIRNNGVKTVNCTIIDDSDAIFTPCVYQIQCDEIPNLTKIISYRGRFAEHVKRKQRVVASGKLESISNTESNETHMQLVLGENQCDCLIPL